MAIDKSWEYGLVVPGKGRLPSVMVAELAVHPAEHPDLGPIGDGLASAGHAVVYAFSILANLVHDFNLKLICCTQVN